MGRRRGHQGRVDANQKQMVDALRKAGVVVKVLSSQGDGCPDILCARAGHMWFIEAKTDSGTLTDRQERFFLTWPAPIHLCRTVEDALDTIRNYK